MISQDYSRAILSGRYIDLLMVSGVQLSSGKSVRCNDKIYLTLCPLALAGLSNQRTSEKSYVMVTFNHVHNRSQWTHLMIGNEKSNKLCKKRERNKAGGGTACQYGCSQSQKETKENPIATICSRTFALTRTLRTSAVSYLSAQNMPACQTR